MCSGGLAAAGEFHRLAAPTAGRSTFRLALLLAVGDEGAPTPGFLQDAVSLDHFVKAAKQAFAVFVVLARDEEQTGLLSGNAGAVGVPNERLQRALPRGHRITRAPTAAIVGMTGIGLKATNRQGRGASAEALGPPVRNRSPGVPAFRRGRTQHPRRNGGASRTRHRTDDATPELRFRCPSPLGDPQRFRSSRTPRAGTVRTWRPSLGTIPAEAGAVATAASVQFGTCATSRT